MLKYLASLLPFHAIMGSDTTSYISGHTKKSVCLTFKAHYSLLSGLGEGDLIEHKFKEADKFIFKLYSVKDDVE